VIFGVGYGFSETGLVGGTLYMLGALGAIGGTFMWLWKSGAWDRFILAAYSGERGHLFRFQRGHQIGAKRRFSFLVKSGWIS